MESKEELEIELIKAKIEKAQVDLFIERKRDKREALRNHLTISFEAIRTVMFVVGICLFAVMIQHA